MGTVTCIAPINIAVLKYWGKRNETLILPTNDSISLTLDTEQLCTKTTVMLSEKFKKDRIWLNGVEEDIKNPRLQICLSEIRKRAKLEEEMMNWKVHICSENNFPTASGLASSASGYACLTLALAQLYKVKGDVSTIARMGSGSACRSTLGGFVRWRMGLFEYGTDSVAEQIAPASSWPEMRCLILVVNDNKKLVSSTVGMKRTYKTSELYHFRTSYIVPERADLIDAAIVSKDFKLFAELTMKDSNQMHAVCLDSYPPIIYLNDISFAIMNLIHSYHNATGQIQVAYTFDAGPNPTLYLLERNVPEVIALLDHYFPPDSNNLDNYKRGLPIETVELSQDIINNIDSKVYEPGKIKYMIYTRIGDGPKYLVSPDDHLLNDEDNTGSMDTDRTNKNTDRASKEIGRSSRNTDCARKLRLEFDRCRSWTSGFFHFDGQQQQVI
ncbi:PREDICTED: diphosphomevalonate decarboxylase isoform X2 [Polistes dominula]|uniref:Diphosphomevalonate decarboxylase n=1 Tax=Polistes dominula TaxID=743375 RepID=A0ABM1IXZ5_POLDO|nr:PREDICTED: diphosphomevalonate decarboxylase isoform X2 [Polistes dominula]